MTTEATTDVEMCDDPETCRKGRVWLAWYAGGLVAVMFTAAIMGGAVMKSHGEATEFAYARDDAAVAMAQTLADSLPRGY
jgi:hypothetical protein